STAGIICKATPAPLILKPGVSAFRSELFLEPYLPNTSGGGGGGGGGGSGSGGVGQQQQQQQVVVNSPDTPPPEPLVVVQRQLHHVQSEGSLSSDNGTGTSADGSSEDGLSEEGCCDDDSSHLQGHHHSHASEAACSITLIERLIRSHPIWFLPGIQRAGAFHLLQGKEEGNFVVRQSSQSDTMALSVRLPAGKGPYIEHYLIQANKGKLSLETSENRFDNIPSLIAHYSQCCDELPVQLTLPRAMREAKNRQQLSSLALLGQEFWRYPMANPKQPPESNACSSSSNTSSLGSFHAGNNNNNNINNNLSTPATESIILNLTPIAIKDSLTTSPASTLTTSTFTSSLPRQSRPTPPNTLNLTSFNEPLEASRRDNKLSPNDRLSQRLISPNLVQNLVRSPSPVAHNVEANVLSPSSVCESVKSPCGDFVRGSQFTSSNTSMTSNFHRNIATGFNELAQIKSPDVVQTPMGNVKSPPPPPPRWAKPGQPQQQQQQQQQSNITLTTTVTFNVNQSGDVSNMQSTPSDSNIPSLFSPQSASSKSLGSKSSSAQSSSAATPILSTSSKLGNRTPQILSPGGVSNTGKPSRRKRDKDARKNSQHYQESDIMESYYRSSPADKISDYEDIWNTTDQSNPPTWSPKDKLMTRCTIVKNDQQLVAQTNEKLIIRNDSKTASEKMSYKEITSPEFTSFKPLPEAKSTETTPSPEDMSRGKRPDLLSRVCSANSLNSPNTQTPPRNKLGLHVLARSESNSPMTPMETKQGSPFYAEPADAILRPSLALVARRRPKPLNTVASKFRHSEPGWLQAQLSGNCHLGVLHPIDWDDSEETEDKTPLISSSVDNLAKRLSSGKEKKCLPCAAKPVQPPKIKPKIFSDTSWAVDSSWEFIGNDADDCEPDYDCDADYEVENGRKFHGEGRDRFIVRNNLTAHNIILQRYPELLKSAPTTNSLHSDRNSSYDNVERRLIGQSTTTMSTTTMNTNATTIEPAETILDTDVESSDQERVKRSRSFKDRLDPLLSPPVRGRGESGQGSNVAGMTISTYALQLAADRTTTFSQNIENFIQCTKEGKEASPHVVMRNMRQFMSGMKNYLVKHGEREFEREVEKQRLKLKPNEFLNLDAILEDVMMRLVVSPLREHVYRLFVEHYAANGSIQDLADSIQLAQSKQLQDLGVRPKIIPPSEAGLERILGNIERLQLADSPLEKLEHLLSAISAIVNSVKHANSSRAVTLGADDLLPLLVWVLVRGKVIDAEIEAEYMWGLLHPSLLTGEGGYYLTTLSSAVHVLKTFKSSQGTMSTITQGCGTPDCSSVLRVLVPDELNGSLNTRTLPVRPNMNTRELCRILAHKIRCTNPQDYGLFKLVQGEETLLGDHDCPQEMSHCLFAYKRIDAKIAWPKTTDSSIITTNGNSAS
ncbi:protein sprint, partial [Phymastichus coffea]|uniref:protein sprint n=1 Tax=Phymastichus coffea TaxID=108790 RepID=UPI00273C8D8C